MRAGAIRVLTVAVALLPAFAAELEKPAKPVISARVPEIFSINPTGARRGTTTRVEILGENLDGTERLEISGPGIEARILKSSYLQTMAEITVAADAAAEINSLRLVSRLGVSNPLGFRVSELPESSEAEPNDHRSKAEKIDCPSVVDAVLFPDEDTDFYRFHAKAGDRVKAEVLAARNGSGLNAEMYLLDNAGLRLAVGDDEERTDPVIEYLVAETADYYVVVRGVFSVLNMSFPTGHPAYTYQFKITSEVQKPPASVATEPEANRIEVPGEARGMIAAAGEIDSYAFRIDEPGAYVFEVQAGREDSMLDSVLTLYDSKGTELTKNDNGSFGQDSQGDSSFFHRFADAGEYRVEIRQAVLDLHGPLYTYRLISRKAQPNFSLTAVNGSDATPWIRSPDRLVAHRGMDITIPVNVEWLEELEKSEADVQLTVEGLPPGISASECWARVKDGKQEKSRFTARAEIRLSIAPDATLGTHPFRITGKAKLGDRVLLSGEKIVVSAAGRYVMAASGGFPHPVTQRYLSIVEPVSFALRPEIGDERYPTRFTMQPGTNKIILLTVLPAEKYVADLEFSSENLPRGMALQHVEQRPETKQYVLHLKADPDCERGWFPIVTFVAHHQGTAIPTPYFGMSVQ